MQISPISQDLQFQDKREKSGPIFWPLYGLIFSEMIFKRIFFQKIPIKSQNFKVKNPKKNVQKFQ